MRAIGIVSEYDPFHLGHQYQIRATRSALGEELPVVCAMSGNWTQRGSAAIADKWSRARLALTGGADLILELPTPWAVSSAEFFARGAVDLLTRTGVVDVLSFGSEEGELAGLAAVADCLDSPGFGKRLRKHLDQGMTFPAARHRAVEEILGEGAAVLENPNNNLGIEYLRAIRHLGSGLRPFTVLRQGDGHNHPMSGRGFPSASALRTMLLAGVGGAWKWIPPGSREILDGEPADLNRVFPAILARLRTMTPQELLRIPDCSDGLEHRIKEAAGRAVSLDSLYEASKSRRYAHARIRRVILRAFLGLTQIPEEVPYLRVLGATERGRGLLRQMKGAGVITKAAHGKQEPLLQREARYTDLYGLCFSCPRPSGLEWRTSPVML